jgi:hypothetical protein
MSAVDEAVDALTRPFTDVVTIRENGDTRYVPIHHAALLDMLRESIGSDLGGDAHGVSSAAERNLLNAGAFSLWEEIDATSRKTWRDLSKSAPSKELKDLVRELAGLIKALRAVQQLDDLTYARLSALFPEWRQQIWERFDAPVVKELIGSCPHCEERFVYAPDGSRSAALIVYYVRSVQPEAKCQRCGEVWLGAKQLLTLGFHLGATVDHEALREMGVDGAA